MGWFVAKVTQFWILLGRVLGCSASRFGFGSIQRSPHCGHVPISAWDTYYEQIDRIYSLCSVRHSFDFGRLQLLLCDAPFNQGTRPLYKSISFHVGHSSRPFLDAFYKTLPLIWLRRFDFGHIFWKRMAEPDEVDTLARVWAGRGLSVSRGQVQKRNLDFQWGWSNWLPSNGKSIRLREGGLPCSLALGISRRKRCPSFRLPQPRLQNKTRANDGWHSLNGAFLHL